MCSDYFSNYKPTNKRLIITGATGAATLQISYILEIGQFFLNFLKFDKN